MKRNSYPKVLHLLLVAFLILALLPGCAQKVDSSVKDNESKLSTTTNATTKTEPVQQSNDNTAKGNVVKVSLPIVPPLINENKTGAIVDLVKAMAAEYKDGEVTIDVYPMARSIENIISGTADCHCPYIKNHNVADSDNLFYYTTEEFGKVIFVLYSNKNVTGLTPENVMSGKYKVQIQPGHKEYLGDLPEATIESGLQMVDSGRIDGYIAAMSTCDQIIKAMQLKNIKRQYYDTFETAIIFKKTDDGKQKRDIFNTLIKKIKENGEYDRIMGELNSKEVFIPDAE
ncbi:substrate-binding periplasmic protein [Acetivibrio clariflavus]|uniref:Periplasmic component of amino acid ABC-type transporter/signal transduction system n=1 Tax=Acetivibrio clariflavus (strain DSM 19732 / NBRC 101661 / EBR45) TaxID=720554 RepID=G8LTD4_ACECE|nr:transporter substrate-binding domain-containing protein [Acetivibrio clariflavus]AEV68381.1 periplasmic component of amino acid ABC-type transporter/signal transduction system [Acetivibrio clariflavus DSM 19732]